jgi:quercetin dioxygenase-like cupin family protein
MVRVFDLVDQKFAAVSEFAVGNVQSAALGSGDGESHCTLLRLKPGAFLGPHEAGFGQLFVVVFGDGWVAGADGKRLPIKASQAAFIARGEVHSKGASEAMMALVIQVRNLTLAATPVEGR